MNPQQPKSAPQTDEHSDWESRLEKLRQTRQLNAPYTHAPLIRESGAAPAPVSGRSKRSEAHRLDDKNRDKVLQEYLLKWQQEHNAEVAQSGREEVETDNMVILQENWLAAQSALQMKASDKYIESTRTVWLNPKHQTVEFPKAQAEAAGDEMPSENQNDDVSDGQSAPEDEVAEKITVNINVLNPQAVNRKEVFCLSEQELTERLIKRMRPHLTDAVNGMIRVVVQKQMALFTYQLQQTLNEQAPDLVEEVLQHNLKKILSDIKYEMKYKK
ncbi:hypothetical protein [Neisseria perflava]|uniref:hypothetical protein n=1 Tax=Neisseria perflava TaxID=33053 RepID=UPI0020A060F9|nr:hypothetical protein [Neisseria perflava]MCP1660165.1 hypothetical protein [Neisseria perflava]MCP1772584.1 hypothetical protein [Neisseria perflava]